MTNILQSLSKTVHLLLEFNLFIIITFFGDGFGLIDIFLVGYSGTYMC